MHAHIRGVFTYDLAPILQQRLDWQRPYWSTGRRLPRKVCSVSIDELLALVPEAVEVIQYISQHYRVNPNIKMWCNLYETGSDWTPYHRDSYDCTVVTVSFGGTRRFLTKGAEGVVEYQLANGDVFVFAQHFNDQHTHGIPKTTRSVQPRVSLVVFCDS